MKSRIISTIACAFFLFGAQTIFAQGFISPSAAEVKLKTEMESIFPNAEYPDVLEYQYTRSKFELFMHARENILSGFSIEESMNMAWEELELAINHIDSDLFTTQVLALKQELTDFLSE